METTHLRTVCAAAGLLVFTLGAAGCGGGQKGQTKRDGKQSDIVTSVANKALTNPKDVCKVVAEVDDARAKMAGDAIRSELKKRAKSGKDRAAVFGLIYAIDHKEDRWHAFKDEAKKRKDSFVGDLGLCITYSKWKMPDQAGKPCQRAEKALPGLVMVEVARADMAARRGNTDDAKALLDKALKTDSTCIPALMAKANLASTGGDPQAAREAWQEALGAMPSCFLCAFEAAKLIESAEGAQAALPLWEQALAAAPTHAETLNRYAAAQVGQNDKAALAAYEKAIEMGREDYTMLMAVAKLAQGADEELKAIDYAEKAAGLKPNDTDAWLFLVGLYEKRNEVDAFRSALDEILALTPDHVPSQVSLARMNETDEEYLAALEHYEEARAAIANGAEVPEGASEAIEKELAELKAKLSINEPGVTGTADVVVTSVQSIAKGVYETRLQDREGLKGTVEITVQTNEKGQVRSVKVKNDTLKDPHVVACLVGNLRVATINGGKQRLTFELSFE